MQLFLLKSLGTLHGLFALYIFRFLWAAHSQDFFSGMAPARMALKTGGTIVGGVLLLLCAWATWKQPHLSSSFAWASLGAFVVTAAADEVFMHGLGGLSGLMPVFYYAVAIRVLAALCLGFLSKTVLHAA